MQFVFDNLSAILIAGVLFLILVAVNHRTRMSGVETATYYSMKQQQLSFVETLKRDLQNVAEIETVSEDPITLEFRFHARTDPANPAVRPVVYRRTFVGERDGVSFYQIRRFVDGIDDGGSPSTIVSWEIVAQNEEGVMVSDVANASQVFVRFEAAAPIAEGQTIGRSRWEASFRPPLLQQANSI